MLRQPIRGVRLPLKPLDQAASTKFWNGASRRLFTSQAREELPAQLWRGRTTAFESLLTRRFGSRPTLPRFGTTYQGFARGELRRGFRFSARRKASQEGAKEGAKEAEASLTLSQRLKKLSKEYGWAAVGVYLALSVLDFPFCFLFVRAVGTEAIGKVEHQVVSTVTSIIPAPVKEAWHKYWGSVKAAETETLGNGEISDKVEMVGWGVEEASQKNKEHASLATQLALAYAIHKSFIFFRVPLTAAVTPKVVKTLRSWGWNIGKKTTRG